VARNHRTEQRTLNPRVRRQWSSPPVTSLPTIWRPLPAPCGRWIGRGQAVDLLGFQKLSGSCLVSPSHSRRHLSHETSSPGTNVSPRASMSSGTGMVISMIRASG